MVGPAHLAGSNPGDQTAATKLTRSSDAAAGHSEQRGGFEASLLKDGWQRQAIAKGLITEQELALAKAGASKANKDVAELLIQSGKLSEELIAQLKAEAACLVYLDVLDYQIDPKVLELVPEHVARKHTMLPLYRLGNALTVAVDDPWNAVAIDEARLSAKVSIIQSVLGTKSAIRKAIDRHYGRKVVEEASKSATMRKPSETAESVCVGVEPQIQQVQEAASEIPVAKLVDALLTEALEARASDIHLEPEGEHLRIRFRVDGVLQEIKLLPAYLHESIASRIKLLAKLDITEHRLPQDGSLSLTIGAHPFDLRVSAYPTIFGENVVIRLLDHDSLRMSLEQLGFAPEALQRFIELIQHPHGIVLVTGPTGSGKTTTLYAALAQINSVSKNIVTIEDPVEYHLPLIRQTQINPKAGVTFATGLRSLLRQDPDIIMVGEIRDRDTAEIAIHAALTGHLVLSTLHTNDAASAAARLLDMGIEPYLLSSTLLGVVAQRLIRRICAHCQQGSRPTEEMRKRYPDLGAVFQGRGCRACRQSGYLGRIGIFELFCVDEKAKALIAEKQSSGALKAHALASGMRSMRADGIWKVKQGLTSLDELDRVVPPEASS